MKPKSPLVQIGWEIVDGRCKNGFSHGLAIFDGKYRSSWDFYKVPQRLAMVSSLAYLKEGKLPPGLMIPMTMDGRYLKHYIPDVIRESMIQRKHLQMPFDHKSGMTVLDKRYDVVCPLPSSRGPPSVPNREISQIIAKALGGPSTNDNGPHVEELICRHSPMTVKSTSTPRYVRTNPDAPRLMHFDNMSISGEHVESIKGQSILLYDDVVTWGNTSEAARNLLLLAGAAQVDCMSCLSTGDVMRAAQYERDATFKDGNSTTTTAESEKFKLVHSQLVGKEYLRWGEIQPDINTWHRLFGEWIEERFPELIPNDVPGIE